MRKLDFIVFGCARSGTTALAKMLRAINQIHCGIELFNPIDDHRQIDVDQAFLARYREQIEAGKRQPIDPEEEMAILQGKGDVRAYGNKFPLYYRRLRGVFEELGTTKSVLCAREPLRVAQSYNMKSREKRSGWPRGRSALFAAGDMMILLKTLAACARHHQPLDILVVPQSALLMDWQTTLNAVADHLLPGVEVTCDTALVSDSVKFGARRQTLKRPDLSDTEATALAALDNAGAAAVLGLDEPCHIGRVGRHLAEVARALPDDHIEFISALARESGPDVREYLTRWERIARRAGADANR